jgi:hypothetical protein
VLLGPDPDRWPALRWLAGADERLLWAILAAAALVGMWGALLGRRAAAGRDQTSD